MSSESHHTVAVTGINGFVGKHLTRELADNHIRVIGIGQEPELNDEIAELVDQYYCADLTNEWPVKSKLDAIIHLAGLAAVGPSFDRPQDYINLNSAMVTNMAEYYLRSGVVKPRFVVVSSGAIYSADQPMALAEDSKLGLDSPYAVSKVLVENMCGYYRKRGLDTVVARPFNHIGPGQLGGFLVPDVISKLGGSDTSIDVGNISTRRDYTDVRDVVRAYRLLATTEHLGHTTYNVCTGKSVLGEDIVKALKVLMNKDGVAIEVDESLVRPNDPLDIYGSSERLREDTGWGPKISLNQTLKDCVDAAL